MLAEDALRFALRKRKQERELTRNFFEAEMPDFGPVFAVDSNSIESMPQRQELIDNATHLENFDCARLRASPSMVSRIVTPISESLIDDQPGGRSLYGSRSVQVAPESEPCHSQLNPFQDTAGKSSCYIT
jgi:hypothetical protein